MKTVNITTNTSIHQHQAVKRWFFLTCMLTTLVLATCMIIYGRLYRAQNAAIQQQEQLKPRIQQLHDILIRKRALKEQAQELSTQLVKINRIGNQPKSPHKLLTVLTDTLPTTISLHTLSLKKNKIDMSIHASNTQTVLAFMEQLKKETSVGQLHLQEIGPHEDKLMKAVLRGTLA